MYVFAGAVSAGLALCVVMISVLQYFLEVIEPPAWPGNPGANGDLFDTSFC